MNILITGCAGFIGFSLAQRLLSNKNNKVIGIDSIDNYYSIKLKKDRLNILQSQKKFKFYKFNLKSKKKTNEVFKKNKIDCVYHLAAQAGVRFSFEKPEKYLNDNIYGFYNVLENSKNYKVKKLFFASSSSVYGDAKKLPVKENYVLDEKNLYSLTKSFNEKLGKIYAQKYNMNICGLRFFTIYGEWGRPDMFMMKYINSSVNKNIFTLYNFGNHKRDFTYIKDVALLLEKLLFKKLKNKFCVINISSSNPYKLSKIMNEINLYFKKPKIKKQERDEADVLNTHGSNKELKKIVGEYKYTNIKIGIKNLCEWYKSYYKLKI